VLIAAIVSVDPFGHRPHPGTGSAFLVLLAFVVSFLAIRTSARLTRSVTWWPGGVQSGGVHIHHLVWVRLQDVYWSQEGRTSFDAVVIAVAFAALVVLGTNPFGLDDPASILGTAAAVAFVLGLAVICFAKSRVLLGVIGLFIPFVALVGALRLGHPSSLWARWRYSGPQMERAVARFGPTRRTSRWQRRIADVVAGAPSEGDP
jgi:hypothetical protein